MQRLRVRTRRSRVFLGHSFCSLYQKHGVLSFAGLGPQKGSLFIAKRFMLSLHLKLSLCQVRWTPRKLGALKLGEVDMASWGTRSCAEVLVQMCKLRRTTRSGGLAG